MISSISKTLFWSAALLAVLSPIPARAAGWPGVFDPYTNLTIYLTIDTQDWDRVRFDQPYQSESWTAEVAQAWMHAEGEDPILVAVRRKGESDIPLPSAEDPRKVSLKIDVNEYVAGQTWHDLKKISLENGSSAPLSEGFAWVLHRQAAPLYGYQAALSGWVRLFINGEEAGLYVHAEQRDETFLRNHDLYSPTCTWLYKVDGGTLLEVGVSNSPAYENLQFVPFNLGPSSARGKPPATNAPPPDYDAYLPQWVDMRGMLTLAACQAYAENTDSLFTHDGKNTFCVDFNPPSPRTRRYYPWDLDTSIKGGTLGIYGTTSYQTNLLDHPWFGRVYEHILRELIDDPLSTATLTNLLDRMEAGLSAAVESDPYVYSEGAAAVFAGLRSWVATRNANVPAQFRHVFVPRPVFNHPGGEVAPGFALDLSAPTGTVYYTLDGTDPRAPGGAPSASALAWTNALPVEAPLHVVARTLVGTNWSGLPAESSFTLARHGSDLRVAEIMYNPLDTNLLDATDNDAYEFIEFRNVGTNALDLSSFYCEGIAFDFPVGFAVAPGAFAVLVRDPAAFAQRYPGVTNRGVYLGKLGNDGEKVRVLRPDGTTVVSVEYDDDPPWVISPDGLGYSLVNREPDGDPDEAANWRASSARFGSPGAEDPAPAYCPDVVINEILAHTDPPLEDAIELHNPTASPVDVGGWFLSDSARDATNNLDPALLKKYRIPAGTILPAGGFQIFYQNAFDAGGVPFALSEFGERVYLSAADAASNLLGHVVALEFGAIENGVSFGRVATSAGPDHAALSARTFGADHPASLPEFRTGTGATNAAPRVGPVVFSEIMYNPPANFTEFIELHNVSAAAVDLSGWNVNGAGFTFPPGSSLPAGGFVLLADTNRMSAADFRVARSVPAECAIHGLSLALDNDGERLTLFKPNVSTAETPLVVESVRYNDKPLWPTEADGGGPALERYDVAAYGNEPLNWRAGRAGGSPGRTNLFDEGLAVVSGSRWKYRVAAASLGTAWRDAAYADSIWPDGQAPLGYGEEGLGTVVASGPDASNKYPTVYFRKAFAVPEDPAAVTGLTFEVRYDDGFVAYLNGTEIARRSMPEGSPEYATLAADHESGTYETIALGAEAIALLQQGPNGLAVEVHQADPESQDLFWDARLVYQTFTMDVAEPPVAVPAGGLFVDSVSVALSSPTPDSEIRYTLDGSTPDESSVLFSSPLELDATTVLGARAYALGYAPSAPVFFSFQRIERDGDADALPDAWELQHFDSTGDELGEGDADFDGASNFQEYVGGTDPRNPSNYPHLKLLGNRSNMQVLFPTLSTDPDSLAYGGLNRYYALEACPLLQAASPVWTSPAGLAAIPADGTTNLYLPPLDASPLYYRLRIWLAP